MPDHLHGILFFREEGGCSLDRVMRAALNAQMPLIFLTPWGFTSFSKPGHQYFDACAEGRFLILAPWPHINSRIALTRAMCLQLNEMAREICEEGGVSTGC